MLNSSGKHEVIPPLCTPHRGTDFACTYTVLALVVGMASLDCAGP